MQNRFPGDLEWIQGLDSRTWTDAAFLEQYAWVVFVSGFRVSTVRRLWERLRKSLLEFEPTEVVKYHDEVRTRALFVFSNGKKVDAILEAANRIVNLPESIRVLLSKFSGEDFISWIAGWPFMGKANKSFLARNLGFRQFAKPDIHLTRLAWRFGYSGDAVELCDELAGTRHASPAEVDVVLWRYASEGEPA